VALTVAEPFCGAGGLGLGLSRAGFRGVWAAESNSSAADTFAAAFPETIVYCKQLDGHETLPRGLDLLAGGPPCQPFSQAGDRLGSHDPRDGLPVMLRLVHTARPRAVLIENVRGLGTARHATYLAAVKRALRDLGYRVQTQLLQAADFGVPQRRERLFVVALRGELGRNFVWPKPTHSLAALVARKYLSGSFDPALATRYELPILKLLTGPEPRYGTKRYQQWVDAVDASYLQPWVTVRQALGELVAEYEPGPTPHAQPRSGRLDAVLVDEGRGGVRDPARGKSLLYKRTRPDVPADTISASAEAKGSEHCAQIALVVRNLGAGDGLGARPDDVAPTVPAKIGGQSGLAAMDAASVHAWTGSEGTTEPGRVHKRPKTILRRLSTAEVARLQGFPDDYPWRGSPTSVYRQIGNAVPPPLASAVGHAIAAALRSEKGT
jgi:site-specific DNA-cytosine methylase